MFQAAAAARSQPTGRAAPVLDPPRPSFAEAAAALDDQPHGTAASKGASRGDLPSLGLKQPAAAAAAAFQRQEPAAGVKLSRRSRGEPRGGYCECCELRYILLSDSPKCDDET